MDRSRGLGDDGNTIPSQKTNAETQSGESLGFKPNPPEEFKFGSVFKMMGAESLDDDIGLGLTGISPSNPISSVRRFVVIDPQGTYCKALSIHTVPISRLPKLADSIFAVVYTGRTPPTVGSSARKPIRIVPTTPRDKLSPDSKLSYATVYTIDYTVSVLFIGNVHRNSEQHLVRDYNSVHRPLPDRIDHRKRVSSARTTSKPPKSSGAGRSNTGIPTSSLASNETRQCTNSLPYSAPAPYMQSQTDDQAYQETSGAYGEGGHIFDSTASYDYGIEPRVAAVPGQPAGKNYSDPRYDDYDPNINEESYSYSSVQYPHHGEG